MFLRYYKAQGVEDLVYFILFRISVRVNTRRFADYNIEDFLKLIFFKNTAPKLNILLQFTAQKYKILENVGISDKHDS